MTLIFRLSGCFVGVIIPDTLDAASRQKLEEILQTFTNFREQVKWQLIKDCIDNSDEYDSDAWWWLMMIVITVMIIIVMTIMMVKMTMMRNDQWMVVHNYGNCDQSDNNDGDFDYCSFIY